MIKSIVSLLRKKIFFYNPGKANIVIFGSFVKNFSFGKNISHLSIDDQIYFTVLFKSFFKHLLNNKFDSLNDCYFYELITHISPKLAIGNEINQNIFKFKRFFPEKVSIGYQIVYWSNIHKFFINHNFGNKKNYACDYFLIFNKKSVKYLNFIKTKFIVTGSIKNNFNLINDRKKNYDLLLISDYREPGNLKLKDKLSIKVKTHYYKYSSKLLSYIKKSAEKNNFKVCVALASSRNEKKHYNFLKKETIFYKKYLGNYIPGNEPVHILASKSKMVISFWSTLGFELLAQKKRVLFLSPKFTNFWNKFPSKNGFNWSQELDQKKILKKISNNFFKNDKLWLEQTKKFRTSIIDFDPNNTILKKIIRDNI